MIPLSYKNLRCHRTSFTIPWEGAGAMKASPHQSSFPGWSCGSHHLSRHSPLPTSPKIPLAGTSTPSSCISICNPLGIKSVGRGARAAGGRPQATQFAGWNSLGGPMVQDDTQRGGVRVAFSGLGNLVGGTRSVTTVSSLPDSRVDLWSTCPLHASTAASQTRLPSLSPLNPLNSWPEYSRGTFFIPTHLFLSD